MQTAATNNHQKSAKPSDRIIGVSPWSRQVRGEIGQVAIHSSNVLITGPTGTGKELIARAIHESSPRRDMPFIPVDCAAIVPNLFASHMFGHIKGAYTGAQNASTGCFRAADGGTLFLDEIGELELQTQVMLLRVLQERMVVPVGAVKGMPVNIRLVAATNQNLAEMVARSEFRQDLYYRLNVVLLETQPLADRPEDIEILSSRILKDLARDRELPLKSVSKAALALLCAYQWPGNVRQLENVLEQAVVRTKGNTICRETISCLLFQQDATPFFGESRQSNPIAGKQNGHGHLPLAGTDRPKDIIDLARENVYPGGQRQNGRWLKLEDLERFHVQRTLEQSFYNQSEAARRLGVTRRVLQGLIKRLDVEFPLNQRRDPR